MTSGWLFLGLLFVLFWFLLIRPQRARAREQQELIRSLEAGDEIVTAGGLYGVITEVDGEVLHLEIADGLVVRTARNAVAGIVDVEEDEEDDDEPSDEAGDDREAVDDAPTSGELPREAPEPPRTAQ